MTSSGPFAYVEAINNGVDIPVGKDYSQYLVNQALSYFTDTIAYVEYLAQTPMPNEAHFRFLRSVVRPRTRRSKWPKPIKDEAVLSVMDYFYVSKNVAEQYVSVLDEQEIARIIETIKVKNAR